MVILIASTRRWSSPSGEEWEGRDGGCELIGSIVPASWGQDGQDRACPPECLLFVPPGAGPASGVEHRPQSTATGTAHPRNPRTSSPGSTSRTRATRRMLCRDRLRWPRSTWPMNVQCSSLPSARASWDSPSSRRRARTRAPNSPAADEMGGLGEIPDTFSSQRAQPSVSRDYASQVNISYTMAKYVLYCGATARPRRWCL